MSPHKREPHSPARTTPKNGGSKPGASPCESDGKGPFEVKPQIARRLSPFDRTEKAVKSEVMAESDCEMQVPTCDPPMRRYECTLYETCLDLAAALNWQSFTCLGCKGEINPALYWRAHQNQRKDAVARLICPLPPITAVEGTKCDPAQEEVLQNVPPQKLVEQILIASKPAPQGSSELAGTEDIHTDGHSPDSDSRSKS